MPLAVRFVEILADTGVSHGLLGPREVPRLWERHVLNCAVVEDAYPIGARLVDVGSGAGLPGVALALARPDLEVHLVEPMLRRTQWLTDTVAELGLEGVTVHRGRAEELAGTLAAPFVTARAVARLDKLARWCVPLLEPGGGTVVAMKGRSATEELEQDRRALQRLGLVAAAVTEHGGDDAARARAHRGPDVRTAPGRPADPPPQTVEGEHSQPVTGPEPSRARRGALRAFVGRRGDKRPGPAGARDATSRAAEPTARHPRRTRTLSMVVYTGGGSCDRSEAAPSFHVKHRDVWLREPCFT